MRRASKSAAKVVVFENNDPIAAETEAIQNRVRDRAFQISQTRPPDASELYDWLMAESQVLSVPAAELIEKDGKFEVKFAVAGVNPDDVNIMVTPDQVVLKSEFSHEHGSDIGTVHLCDFKSATIFRSVSLPQPINVNSVKIASDEGLIVVTAAKQGAEQTRPKRTSTARKTTAKKPRAKAS